MRRSISTPLAVLAELFVIYLIFNLLNKEDSEYNERSLILTLAALAVLFV